MIGEGKVDLELFVNVVEHSFQQLKLVENLFKDKIEEKHKNCV